ncbi:MAG: Crp/Fnr family transcriptional regulator [Leptolyngbyaceae cyanobacterium]
MNQSERVELLQSISLLQAVPDQDWLADLADHLDELEFGTGATIVSAGQAGHLLYLLTTGKATVALDATTLAELSPGAVFGEMALFDTRQPSASVTALQPTHCLVLTQAQLYQAIKTNPTIALNLIHLLADRVRLLNRLFGASEDLYSPTLKTLSHAA